MKIVQTSQPARSIRPRTRVADTCTPNSSCATVAGWLATTLVLAGAAAAGEQAGATVTRADLADAYVRFERTYAAHPPADARIEDVNRAFDQASVGFFSGQFADTIGRLNELAASLTDPPQPFDVQLIHSLKVTIDPPVGIVGGERAPRISIDSMYPLRDADERRLELRLQVRARDSTAFERTFPVAVGKETAVEQNFDLRTDKPLPAGRYDVKLIVPDGTAVTRCVWFVAPRSLDLVRRENRDVLEALNPESPELGQAVEICRGRNELLTDQPSPERSAEFLCDPLALTEAVAEELAQIKAGRNPYRRRAGETYRVLGSGPDAVPYWVVAPPSAVRDAADERLPVVVAFHGAGGDERMFLDGYGAGAIARLAVQRRTLLVAPLTYPFLRDARLFDRLIDAIERDYAIDRGRVYVLGHSLGAGAAGLLAVQRADALAAAVCLAGGRGFASASALPPTLVLLGGHDPLVPSRAIEREVRRAADAGLPIEVRELAEYGHTLLVTKALPEAIDFLLSHRRTKH